jgi:hypothetical protein
MIGPRWIEEHDSVDARSRNKPENRFHQVSVGIEECEAFTTGEVLGDEILQERRLSRTGFPEDPEMAEAIVGKHAEAVAGVSKMGLAENEERMSVDACRSAGPDWP